MLTPQVLTPVNPNDLCTAEIFEAHRFLRGNRVGGVGAALIAVLQIPAPNLQFDPTRSYDSVPAGLERA